MEAHLGQVFSVSGVVEINGLQPQRQGITVLNLGRLSQ